MGTLKNMDSEVAQILDKRNSFIMEILWSTLVALRQDNVLVLLDLLKPTSAKLSDLST